MFGVRSVVAVTVFFHLHKGYSQARQPCIYNGSRWMMDLTGVPKSPGKKKLLLVFKRHDGRKFAEQYFDETVQDLKASAKFPNLPDFFKSTIALKDAAGKEAVVTGDCVWDITQFQK